MKSADPVIPALEGKYGMTYAKDQPQYSPLRALRGHNDKGVAITRWQLTDDERKQIAEGADLILSVFTFRNPLQPLRLEVMHPTALEDPAVVADFEAELRPTS